MSNKNEIPWEKQLLSSILNYGSDAPDVLSEATKKNIIIYQNNYLHSHIGQLRRIYQTTEKFLVENNFKFFCFQYLTAHPPTDANIEEFGHEFSTFLAARPELVEKPIPAQLSKFDHCLYHGAVNQPFESYPGMLSLWQKLCESSSPIETNVELKTAAAEILVDSSKNCSIKLVCENNTYYFIEGGHN